MPSSHILFVCTGNVFRSPMGQAFLEGIARARGLELTAESVGTLPGDRPISPLALEAIDSSGSDMSTHRSRLLDTEAVERADLVVGMAREHVREVVLLVPSAWPRTFTLKELVRRGEVAGPRRAPQSLAEWLVLVATGRQRGELLGWSIEDDVLDPVGGTAADCRATGEEIRHLVLRFTHLIDP